MSNTLFNDHGQLQVKAGTKISVRFENLTLRAETLIFVNDSLFEESELTINAETLLQWSVMPQEEGNWNYEFIIEINGKEIKRILFVELRNKIASNEQLTMVLENK